MMRKPHIEAKSSNGFEKNGKPKLLTSGKLLLQKTKKQTRVMMVKSTRMTANRPKQSLNDLLAIPRGRSTHHPRGSNLPMTTSMSTLVQVSQNSHETADVTPIDTPKKSEEAKSENDPDGSSHRREDKAPRGSTGEGQPKPSSKLRQPVQYSAGSSHRKVHKLPQGSAGEGLSGPSSKLKQSTQQATKSESEDSSSSSSSSSYSESSDEERFHQRKR